MEVPTTKIVKAIWTISEKEQAIIVNTVNLKTPTVAYH